MKEKTISTVTQAIQTRFFKAIDLCADKGSLSGITSFCDQYKLNRPKYLDLQQSETSRYKLIDFDAIYYLAKDFGVSLDWLFYGRGEAFKHKTESVFRETKYGRDHDPIPVSDRMTPEETGVLLNLTKWQLYNMTQKRTIPFGYFGHRIVFSRSEIDAWKEEKEAVDEEEQGELLPMFARVM